MVALCVRYIKRYRFALSVLAIFTTIWWWTHKESANQERYHDQHQISGIISNQPIKSNQRDRSKLVPQPPVIKDSRSNERSKLFQYRKFLRKISVPYAAGINHTSLIRYLLSNASDLNHVESEKGSELLSRIKTDCRDRICSEFLTDLDKPHFKYCVRKTWRVALSKYSESQRSSCVFINGSKRYPIALASYPGSGNTWVRGILQKTTGLCIGAIYCDVTLRQNGYPGESIRSGITFLVKTHQTDPRWEGVQYDPDAPFKYFHRAEDIPMYSGGVFILRNPFHAMVSEFKRKTSESAPNNHVITLSKDRFGNNSQWNSFVLMEAIVWQQTVLAWLINNKNRPVMAVKYEHLKVDTRKEIEKILHFVSVPYSRRQLEKVLREGYDEYRRPHGKEFEHYTDSQKRYVRNIVSSIASSYDQLDISDYLQP